MRVNTNKIIQYNNVFSLQGHFHNYQFIDKLKRRKVNNLVTPGAV